MSRIIQGQGMWLPRWGNFRGGTMSSLAIADATGEKVAIIGRVWNKDGTAKSIRTVAFRFGSVVKAGGSALTLSLQNVSLTSGPVLQPDETQDETYAIANGNVAFSTDGEFVSGNLSADRAVSFGELLAVVVEYDGGGRLGSDSFAIVALDSSDGVVWNQPVILSKAGGTWATHAQIPIVLFGFSDGTYGTFFEAAPNMGASTSRVFNINNATHDEIGMEFSLPFDCWVDGAWFMVSLDSNAANYDVVLYEGSTAVETVSMDANNVASLSAAATSTVCFSGFIRIKANTVYRLVLKPTTTTNLTILTVTSSSGGAGASAWSAGHGGMAFCGCYRVDGGSWTRLASERPRMGLRIAGAAAGVLRHPGMAGGLSA